MRTLSDNILGRYTVGGKCIYHTHSIATGSMLREFDVRFLKETWGLFTDVCVIGQMQIVHWFGTLSDMYIQTLIFLILFEQVWIGKSGETVRWLSVTYYIVGGKLYNTLTVVRCQDQTLRSMSTSHFTQIMTNKYIYQHDQTLSLIHIFPKLWPKNIFIKHQSNYIINS